MLRRRGGTGCAAMLAAFWLIAGLFPAIASAQLTTAAVTGVVRDQTGAVLPGATVTATHQDTGRVRTTVTSEQGVFRVDGLPPGPYTLKAELTDFTTVERRDVILSGTVVATVDLTLNLSKVAETVRVVGDAPLVDMTQNQVKTPFDAAMLEMLPLSGRRFQDFALLAPGVHTDLGSTRAGDTDSISFFGFNERYKSLYVDGVDLNDELTGGGTGITDAPRAQFSMEAIDNMEVVRNQFSAEIGRQQAGAINVITKSGTNRLAGRAFTFFRDDAFDEKNYFQTGTLPFQQFQGGGNIGGPIIADRTHYFFNYERWDSETASTIVVPAGLASWVPDPRTEIPSTNLRNNFFWKLSHSFTPAHLLNVTYLYDIQSADGLAAEANAAADARFVEDQDDHFLVGRLTSTVGAKSVNELRLAYSRSFTDRPLPPGDNGRAQQVFPGLTVGTPSNMPQARTQTNYILMNVLTRGMSWKGEHSLKLGGEVNIIRYPSSLATFQFGEFRFARAEPPSPTNRPTQWRITDYNFIVSDRDSNFYGLFVQDDWRIGSRLVLNLGVRYDVETYSGSYDGEDYPQEFDNEDDAIRFMLTILPGGANEGRVFKARNVDYDNVQPRIGFNWSATEDGRTSVRGGYGLFMEGGHDPISVAASLRADRAVSYLATAAQFDLLSFFPGRPSPELLSRIPRVSLTPAFPGVLVTSAYATHYTLGVERQLPGEMAVAVDFAAIRSRDNPRSVNVNHPDGNGVCRFLANCNPVVVNLNDGRMDSTALTVQARRRFTNNVGFLVSYTYMEANEDGPSTSPYLRDQDFGPMPNDIRNRLVMSINARLPWQFDLSTIVNVASAFPYNATAGQDTTGDRVAAGDRPADVAYNSLRGDEFFTTDLRVSRAFQLRDRYRVELMWEMFNVFNTVNFNNYVGAVTSTLYQQPVQALKPFQGQLGVRFTF